jgi:hypothetical protein
LGARFRLKNSKISFSVIWDTDGSINPNYIDGALYRNKPLAKALKSMPIAAPPKGNAIMITIKHKARPKLKARFVFKPF